jgi:hypothetical protein
MEIHRFTRKMGPGGTASIVAAVVTRREERAMNLR